MKHASNEINEMIRQLFAYMGFSSAQIEGSLEYASLNYRTAVILTGILENPELRLKTEIIDELAKLYADPIKKSQMVQEMLCERDAEIAKLKSQVVDLLTEVNRLKPYAQHFEVEMKLRHGDKK
jgi:hypothetical protein